MKEGRKDKPRACVRKEGVKKVGRWRGGRRGEQKRPKCEWEQKGDWREKLC
jgi:hypothetical protein